MKENMTANGLVTELVSVMPRKTLSVYQEIETDYAYAEWQLRLTASAMLDEQGLSARGRTIPELLDVVASARRLDYLRKREALVIARAGALALGRMAANGTSMFVRMRAHGNGTHAGWRWVQCGQALETL
jgi:hypothetical protein